MTKKAYNRIANGLRSALRSVRGETFGNNLWQETVANIYDECHFGQNSIFSERPVLAQKIIAMIEARHSEYFCVDDPDERRR